MPSTAKDNMLNSKRTERLLTYFPNITREQLSKIYDQDVKKFQFITAFYIRNRRLVKKLPPLESLSSLYDDNYDQYETLTTPDGVDLLTTEINGTLVAPIETLLEVHIDKLKAFVFSGAQPLLEATINNEPVATFEQLSALYDAHKEKYKLLISHYGHSLLTSTIKNEPLIAFKDLAALSHEKIKAILSSGSMALLTNKINGEPIATIAQLSTLQEQDAAKYKTFTSYETVALLAKKINGAPAVSFNTLSDIYDTNKDEYKAITSAYSIKLLTTSTADNQPIVTLKQLRALTPGTITYLSSYGDALPALLKAQTSDKQPITFKSLLSLNPKKVQVLGLRNTQWLLNHKTKNQPTISFEALIIYSPKKIKGLADTFRTLESLRPGKTNFQQLSDAYDKNPSDALLSKNITPLLGDRVNQSMNDVSFHTTYGVEIECCSKRGTPTLPNSESLGWAKVEDSSLHGENFEDETAEYVSPILTKKNIHTLPMMTGLLHEQKLWPAHSRRSTRHASRQQAHT